MMQFLWYAARVPLVRAPVVTSLGAWLRHASMAALLCGCGGQAASEVAQPATSTSAREAAPPRDLTPAEIAKLVMPSVVAIRGERSLGSGFVVRKDGWVATNLHVLVGSRELKVVLKDSSELPVVEVLAVDSEHDLALLRIDKSGLPVLTMGDSGAVRAGDAVVAIGHPMGLEDTVSDGLVSAVREVDPTLTLLQISAPIAPGSSGGPLIDSRGYVIGIATMVSREGQNLAFGVPSAYLKTLMANTAPVSWKAFLAQRQAAVLPSAPKRNIPKHALSFVAGCGEGDLRLLAAMMGKAIDVGAPLYNSGNFEACYHVYEGASLDAERKLGAACQGPKKALADGRRKAAALSSDPSAQAWAMRDAFDGLIDVIVRKLEAD